MWFDGRSQQRENAPVVKSRKTREQASIIEFRDEQAFAEKELRVGAQRRDHHH